MVPWTPSRLNNQKGRAMGSCLNATAVHRDLTNILSAALRLNGKGRDDLGEVDTLRKKKGTQSKDPFMENDPSQMETRGQAA